MDSNGEIKEILYKQWWFWLIIVILFMMFVRFFSSLNDDGKTQEENNIINNSIKLQERDIYKSSNNNHTDENLVINNSTNTNLTKNKNKEKHLIVSNGYRFKNTIDEVKLYFEEIYIISEWKGIKPHNDYFLIMKATATSNTPSDNSYHFPYIVSDSSKKQYISINNTFKYDYEDLEGNTVDIATEINLGYVKKEEGKISAYNTDFVSGGNGTRYLVFDIPKKTAEDSEIYFVFSGTIQDTYINETPPKDVYFANYIDKR